MPCQGGGRGCEPNPDPGKLGSYKKIGEGTGEAAHGSIDDSAILFFLSVCVFSSACAKFLPTVILFIIPKVNSNKWYQS
jgi:hypothetical protein